MTADPRAPTQPPQRWRIAVLEDGEWRWAETEDGDDFETTEEHRVIPGPPFVLPSAEPQAVQEFTPAQKAGWSPLEQEPPPDVTTSPPLDIDALEKLYKASTPGEWFVRGDEVRVWEGEKPNRISYKLFTMTDWNRITGNAEFAVAAHEFFPKLLAEIHRAWTDCQDAYGKMHVIRADLTASRSREQQHVAEISELRAAKDGILAGGLKGAVELTDKYERRIERLAEQNRQHVADLHRLCDRIRFLGGDMGLVDEIEKGLMA